jgi:hypothetical protein
MFHGIVGRNAFMQSPSFVALPPSNGDLAQRRGVARRKLRRVDRLRALSICNQAVCRNFEVHAREA